VLRADSRPDSCLTSQMVTEMFKFEVPSLTVGTLDTLMVCVTAWVDEIFTYLAHFFSVSTCFGLDLER
jgi:hypothetical protein